MNGSTLYEQGVMHTVDKMAEEKPGDYSELARWMGTMHNGKYNQEKIAVVCQSPQGNVDIYDAFCVLEFWTSVYAGETLVRMVPVDRSPERDANTQDNQAGLSSWCAPFSGTYYLERAGGGADGSVSWDKPIEMFRHTKPDDPDKGEFITVEPGRAPLEVGYTSAAKTLIESRQMCSVARWPYGSKYVWIFNMSVPYSRGWRVNPIEKRLQRILDLAGAAHT